MTGEKVSLSANNETDSNGKRERSTIEFPYGDLDDAIEIARTIHANAGSSCTTKQLAAYLKQSSTSGAFRLKTATAGTFGVTKNERGAMHLTDLGMNILDPSQEKKARVDAFLNVPLYQKIFDKFDGYTLPPPAALEREMVQLGVSSKQKDKARQAFERSAKQAGFFAHGNDRLVMPANLGKPQTRPIEAAPPSAPIRFGSGGGGDGYHPFIQGLLTKLPEPETEWPLEEQAHWLQTAANIFGLLYTRSGDGHINVRVRFDRDDNG